MLNMRKTETSELSIDQLKLLAPSIFTDAGSTQVSERYAYISTLQVLEGLRKEGFIPVKAMQCRSRIEEKKAFTKHLIRFRHIDSVATLGGLFPEVVLINAHDGSSAYKLMAGIYRLVCSNGMIAGTTYQALKVRHQGDIVGNVIEGTYSVIKDSQKMLESSDNMSRIELKPSEKQILAEAVHQLKFEENPMGEGFSPEAFLKARRYQEQGKNDLFTVFNIAQENIIKGGVKGYKLDEKGYKQRSTTREVKSIDQSTSLNRALWTLAEKMAELKAA